jgi:hypothetical protein
MPFQDEQTKISAQDIRDRLQSWEDTVRVQVRTCVCSLAVLIMHGGISAVVHVAS